MRNHVIGYSAVLAALVMVVFCAGTALAEAGGPHEGDWIGVLNGPVGPLTTAVHLKMSASGPSATIDVVEFGSQGAVLANVTVAGSKLHFEDPVGHAQFDGTWDETDHRWNGAWTMSNGQALPLVLSPGLPPPLPRVDGLDGDWRGGIDAGAAGTVHLVLHVRTGADGTKATLDSPDQGALDLPVLLSREGRKVSVNMAIIAARYQGELSEDSASLHGQFSRGQIGLPLMFSRSSDPAPTPPPGQPR